MRSTIVLQLSVLLSLASAVPAAWSVTGVAAPAYTATAESVAVSSGGITYVTRAGDTLSSIAQRFTSKPDNWIALGKLNRINADTNIPVGTSIVIPADLLLDDPTEARVVALSGSITANAQDGKSVLLGLGAKITEGMQIDTGNNSFLTLSLPDQSRMSLPSNSRIKVVKLRLARYTHSPRTEITLLQGRVESKVAPLEQSKGRFEIRSPFAVAGVRGTHFRVGINDNGTATEVLSGHVAVGHPDKPTGLVLHAGQGDIINGKSVGKAVNLLPTPQLADTPERQGAAAALFVLTPIPGAQSYHVQIATDQEAQNIVLEGRSTSTRVRLDGLPNGDYYARISAIDKLGLEGPASTHAFTLTASSPTSKNQPSQAAPYVDRTDNKQLVLKWNAAPGQKFLLQVARDPAFSWLVYNTRTDAPEAKLPRPAFGTYYARVQPINSDGSAGVYSLAQPFIVTDQWIIHDGNPISVKENSGSTLR